jgi:hypothetical protein
LRIPGSEKSTPHGSQFDPAKIQPFSVLCCDYLFAGDPDPLIGRRFVCLEHRSLDGKEYAFCLKATSKVGAYTNNPGMMAGAVFYPAGTLQFFKKDTVIQPDNQFPIPHLDLIRQHRAEKVRILGSMPDSFPGDLIAAVEASRTMTPREQKRIIECLNNALGSS